MTSSHYNSPHQDISGKSAGNIQDISEKILGTFRQISWTFLGHLHFLFEILEKPFQHHNKIEESHSLS